MPHRLDPGNGDDSAEPLSSEEIKRLRRMIRADDRARWFWVSARSFALWLTAVTVAVAAVKNTIIDLFFSGKH